MAAVSQLAASSSLVARNAQSVGKDSSIAPSSVVSAKDSFFGAPLRAVSTTASASSEKRSTFRLQVTARKTAGAVTEYEAEVDKPLGLTLGEKPGGGVQITGIFPGGNAAKGGLRVGDQVIYTSSFFGDELWPSDNIGFTRTAVNAKPDSVYFVVARGGAVDVKKLRARPVPPRFGRKLTDAQKARATHICLDCGFIYTLPKPFDEQPSDYECPQCSAPKKRFARYDPETGRAIGGSGTPLAAIASIVIGAGLVGAAVYFGLQ